MEFNVKVRKIIENGKPLKATCSVTMDGQFTVHGVKVIKTEKGSFIAMPFESYKDAEGNEQRTSSGKTTLLNALLTSIPDNKRIFTIESGSRELSLVRVKDGEVVNNVVHTLSRPSDNPVYNIAQENLVVASLRFNPDIVVVGEIRDAEAYSAVEASLTGHTVVSTIHASAANAAHTRLALLCQKRFPINFDTSLMQAGQAFPIVVFAHKLEDNSRKIMDISECIITGSGERKYRTLFRYAITKNEIQNGKYVIEGHFEQPNVMSENLKRKLTQFGVPQDELKKYLGNEEKFK